MHHGISRRNLLTGAAAGAAALTAGACASTPKRVITPGRLRHAGIGVGGMGKADLERISSHPDVDVVALCDVDSARLEAAQALHPDARAYTDWRELLAAEEGALDSVHVSTPDHMHAPPILAALARGLHVYGQKPLTRTVREAREVASLARRAGVATQMGTQNRSGANYARAKAVFDTGVIGKVHEVHVWTDRPNGWWPQGVGRPEGEDLVPETLDWERWLGVAPVRPYKEGMYHPFSWRGWKDFGTGAQGDMACHLMDPATWFLELGDPLTIRSDGPAPNDETYPLWSRVNYTFAPNHHTTRGPLLLTWHDGKRQPLEWLRDLEAGDEVPGNGCLFVGTEGALLANPYGRSSLLPESKFLDVEFPEGEGSDHWHTWVDACLGRGETNAPFDYAAHLTEVALLGNVALHFPHETLEWDGGRGRFPGREEADAYLGASYRESFPLELG